MAGKDVTDAFANYHPEYVYRKYLPSFYIGEVADYQETEFQKEARQLRTTIKELGWMKTDWSYFYKMYTW